MGKHAARPETDLERRRRAIVRALRGELDTPTAPAEPSVVVPNDRLHRLERDVAAVRGHLADLSARLHHVVTEVTHSGSAPAYPANHAEGDGSDSSPDDEESFETPRVPAVEPVRPMSDTAARALFGY